MSPERRVSPNRRAKMSPGRENMRQQQQQAPQHGQHDFRDMRDVPRDMRDMRDNGEEGPTPICRCRVLYLGSAVPHVTKDGLQGIQEPLKELYPEDGALGAKGIDSWLSVWSNGFLLENVDENRKKVSRFFPIDSLHYCAAVRYVSVPGTSGEKVQRFLPLDSPFARNPNINHPPLFAAILRRTTGIKVLECHVFICKRETAANALVRCSFHAYADSTYAKHLESGASLYGTVGGPTPLPPMATPTSFGPGGNLSNREYQQSVMEMSDDSINSIERIEDWRVLQNGNSSPSIIPARHELVPNGTSSPNGNENGNGHGEANDEMSVFNGDDNHKVWAGEEPPRDMAEGNYDYGSTMRSFRSSASGLSGRHRPRQMMMQSPPPPPIQEELIKEGKEEKKEKKKKKKPKMREGRDIVDGELMPPLVNGNIPNGNGMRGSNSMLNMSGRPSSGMGGRKMSAGSFMGQNTRLPVNGHGPPRGMGGGPPPNGPPPMMMMPGGHPGPGPRGKKAGTFSARNKGGQRGQVPPFMMYGPGPGGPGAPPPHMMPPMGPPMGHPGPPPHLMPPPGHPLYGQPMYPGPPQMGGGRPDSRVMEEPIYMPHNARPLSPVASYQPGQFPYDAYYQQQQYATIDKAGRHRKHPKQSKQSKQQSSDSNAEDSENGGTGIYKKGHINERAFSASIKNEHRSRSYGSLTNIPLGPNGEAHGPNGESGSPELLRDEKKDREIMQMMGDLELSEDQLERSEVPAGFYPPPNMYPGHPGPMHMNGPTHGPPGRRKR